MTPQTPAKEVKVFARYIHVAPRKLRLVADMIRRQPVDMALEQLRFSSKNAALPITKALNSAIANAVHNFNLKKEDLFVKSITIDGGPVYKKMVPRAQGRGFIERKRTSHINLILEAKEHKGKAKARSIFARRAAIIKGGDEKPKATTLVEEGKVAAEKPSIKQAPKTQEKIKKNLVDLKRRLFNRKSGG